MKNLFIFSLIALSFACKTDKTKVDRKPTENAVAETVMEVSYPEDVIAVFNAHGGLDLWKSFKTLEFTIPKTDAPEMHTIALKSRKDKITMPEASMGFDGSEVWLLDEGASYSGDAIFYHNLMFYFFAMPFVLADDGIVYSETEPLEFEGKSYPGIRISYNSGIGASPKDEYFLHYDAETFQMQWLGYTVTYRSGEVSDNVKWIRYNDWVDVSGVILPKSITWFTSEDNKLSAPRNIVLFEDVSLSTKEKSVDFYAKPEMGVFVEK